MKIALRNTALRSAISVLLVALLLWKIPLREVGVALHSVPLSGLALSLVVMAGQLLVGVGRWKRMLFRAGAPIPFRELLSDTLVASAYNLVLPSSTGGDVVRALRCSRRLAEPHHAWSTMIFERLVGIVSLAVVAAPGIAIVPGGRALILPASLCALSGAMVLLFANKPLRWISRLAIQRAPRIASLSQGVADDLTGPLATLVARAEAFAWSMGYQLLGLSILTACVLPTGNRPLVVALYAGLPLIVILAMVPVTIAGLGLRESLFVAILGRLGVGQATALALAFLWLGSYVVLALVGVLASWVWPMVPERPVKPSLV